MLDTQQFTYTVDMFRDTLQLLVETLENPFVALANIHTIDAFMNRVGYQGVVDKVSFLSFESMISILLVFLDVLNNYFVDYAALLWMYVSLLGVYTTGNVSVQGMLIPDAFLIANIRETNDFKEYETVFMKVDVLMKQTATKRKQIAGESSSPRKSLKLTIKKKQLVKKDDDDFKDKIELESHKDNPEVVDDDDNETEKKDDEMGSLEIRNKETQTTIPTPIRSPKKSLSLDKNISVIDGYCFHYKYHNIQTFKFEETEVLSKDSNYSRSTSQDVQMSRVNEVWMSKRSKYAMGSLSKAFKKRLPNMIPNTKSQQEWEAWVEENVIVEDE
ncbi:hypothetical protein Tco_1387002 [Tanacetum coccineum]